MPGMDAALSQIIERVRAAAADATPLRIRGGGSKDFYGQSLEGELLDTGALAGITSYEPSELVVTARAGTPLAELEALLAANNQCLPFEPPHFGSRNEAPPPPLGGGVGGGGLTDGGSTVGGMVAAGLSGPARAAVGAVRDYVLGLGLLNGRAELLVFGGQVMKNVAGYDLSRLMAGALGTLGLITEVSLKVLPQAPAEATLLFELDQGLALDQLHRWGGQPLPLNASCWLLEQCRGRLYLRLRGAVAAVEAACRSLGGERLAPAAAGSFWRACRDQKLPFFAPPSPGMGLWRLSVAQTAPALALPGPQLLEWQGGQRWFWAPPAQSVHIRAAAHAAGGHATLFIAPRARDAGAEARFDPLKPALQRIHRQLKAEFDPAGIFNRGRLYADF